MRKKFSEEKKPSFAVIAKMLEQNTKVKGVGAHRTRDLAWRTLFEETLKRQIE